MIYYKELAQLYRLRSLTISHLQIGDQQEVVSVIQPESESLRSRSAVGEEGQCLSLSNNSRLPFSAWLVGGHPYCRGQMVFLNPIIQILISCRYIPHRHIQK